MKGQARIPNSDFDVFSRAFGPDIATTFFTGLALTRRSNILFRAWRDSYNPDTPPMTMTIYGRYLRTVWGVKLMENDGRERKPGDWGITVHCVTHGNPADILCLFYDYMAPGQLERGDGDRWKAFVDRGGMTVKWPTDWVS